MLFRSKADATLDQSPAEMLIDRAKVKPRPLGVIMAVGAQAANEKYVGRAHLDLVPRVQFFRKNTEDLD